MSRQNRSLSRRSQAASPRPQPGVVAPLAEYELYARCLLLRHLCRMVRVLAHLDQETPVCLEERQEGLTVLFQQLTDVADEILEALRSMRMHAS